MAANGDVFTWGRVLEKALGPRDSDEWLLPDARRGRAGEAVDVAAGEAHVAVTSLTGDAYTWGHNHHGQCARDPGRCGSLVPSPTRTGGTLASAVARRAACGRYHTAVLSLDGAVYTFGSDFSGQLGRGHSPAGPRPSWEPEMVSFEGVEGLAAERCPTVLQVACGDEHTICLTASGRVLAFGNGDRGQLGMGGVKCYRSPALVRTLTNICEVAAGPGWSLLRDRTGGVYLAGRAKDAGDDGDCRLLKQLVSPR